MSYTEQLLKQDRIRIIGVCYGHQIVGRALGMRVGRSDRGWEASVTLVKMTEKGKELFKKDILVGYRLLSHCPFEVMGRCFEPMPHVIRVDYGLTYA